MCSPIMLLGAVSTVANYSAQVAAANQQAQYQAQVARARNEEIIANNEVANAAAIDSYTQQNQRLVEEQAAHSQELQDLNVEKRNAVGELLASNLNTGMSLDALYLDYERQADRYQGVQEASLKSLGLQTGAEKKQTYATAQNRMNSITPYIQQPVSSPSIAGLALGLAGNVVSGLDTDTPTFKDSSTPSYSQWTKPSPYYDITHKTPTPYKYTG